MSQTVVQPSKLPTRKLGGAMVALVVVKAGLAIGNAYGLSWMALPEVTNAAEVAIPFAFGYFIKDKPNT